MFKNTKIRKIHIVFINFIEMIFFRNAFDYFRLLCFIALFISI